VLTPISSKVVAIYDNFPNAIHANETYVIHSHGLIVQGDHFRPISPKYGQYDFPGIKRAQFSRDLQSDLVTFLARGKGSRIPVNGDRR
jgi:hypothetical protein